MTNKGKYLLITAILVSFSGCGYMGTTMVGPAEPNQPAVVPSEGPNSLTVCSFNIQFLGNSKKRENEALASILKLFDIVVVQELLAPPVDGNYPDGTPYTKDPEAAAFFKAMSESGFIYKLSEEDTGTGDKIHLASSATEWWVAFYNPNVVRCADDIPWGFLAEDRSNHPDFERVPYAFAFRTKDEKLDFVLISVHLKPDPGPGDRARRKHELATIATWINDHNDTEKDFIILGDMNIYDVAELAEATPPGYLSMNNECRPTNTKGDEPYDHVMYQPTYTPEIDTGFGFQIINLIEVMKPLWLVPDVNYPGDPYDHDLFRQYYSDHNPVVFKVAIPSKDDD